MKKTLITGIAALLLATGAAHASGHLTFLECGPYLIVNTWAAPEGGGPLDKWERVLDRSKGWNETNNRQQFSSSIRVRFGHLYYRTRKSKAYKCQEIGRSKVKETD